MRYQSTTGLSADQIQELVARIIQVLDGKKSGRGRPPTLPIYRSVVLTLILLRSNLTQALAADLFGISQPTASRIFRRFSPLIEQALCLHVPPVPEVFVSQPVLVDGTLIPTGNRAGQKVNHSGERHRAGLGVQVGTTFDGGLLAVSEPYPGSVHDRRAVAEAGWEELLARTTVIADLGYQGTSFITPRRTPRGGELSANDKECNKEISVIRSAVERAIAHLKNWKILATGYRGRLAELPAIVRIVTALEFYRLGW